VLNGYNLRHDNLDDLKSVIDGLEVVVSEVSDLQCPRMSPDG
jgi:hypothetical protein